MKIQNKTLMYRIDKIKLIDLDTLIEEACADNVPGYASVSIKTDGLGVHVVFEWVEQKVPEYPYKQEWDIFGEKVKMPKDDWSKLKPGDPAPWIKYQKPKP